MRSTTALVAEIKTLYGQRNKDKLRMQADMVELRKHGWTQRRIADATGVPQSTVDRWLRGYDESLTQVGQDPKLTPNSEQERSDRAVARRVLSEQPLEFVERMIDELPRERRVQIGRAFDHSYSKARADHDDRERNLTPAQRSEREAAAEKLTLPARQAAAGFAALGIIGHLEQALEELHELTADGSLTSKLVRQIDRAHDAFGAELAVAKGLVGIEE
jgi:transcriptional regulator with XRE-family HTH domain